MELKYDIYRYSKSTSFLKNLKSFFSSSGLRFLFYYRNCQRYSRNNPIGIFYRILYYRLSSNRKVEIPFQVKMGKGIYFGHFKNITIHSKAEIGENCNIMQGVTIGNESRGKRKGAPRIGDYVVVGPNSVITGNVTIGDHVLIAPLTFVNFDVPHHSVVIGNPAKIVSEKGSEGYINNLL